MTPLDGAAMAGSYDYLVVALSALIAVLASYATLDLAERVTAARGAAQSAWLIGGAIAMGIGIWSMHFTGMLAFRLPVRVWYHWPTVLLSLLAAIVASATALFVVHRRKLGWLAALAGSIFQGGGIVALHYTAMASMRLPARCHYSPAIVAFSVLLAIAGSLFSLWLMFLFREGSPGRKLRKALSALAMGATICVMHYTGMAAASFTRSGEVPDLSHATRVSALGTGGYIGIVTVMVLVVALLTCLADRLQERTALLDGLFEQAPQAFALLGGDLRVVRVNREFTRLFGYYTKEETHGRLLSELIVPDDARDAVPGYLEAVLQGQRVDAEVVRRRKDGVRLHVLMVCVPVSVPGGRIAVYAMYRDITARKAAEAALHQLSGRLLCLQDEERRRLARELHDSTAQLLVALGINLSVVNESAGALEPRARRALDESRTLADQCLREIRTASYLLHPPELDELGLQSALASYIDGFAQRSGIQVDLDVAPELGRLPQEAETALFRIVQEALSNVHRHSGSSWACVRLVRGSSSVTLEISDRGRGMRSDTMPGVGIASMRERAQQLGGWLEIVSPNHGTTVRAVIPVSGTGA
ncbi:MAG TPA: MHYT domain-containing protein [Bryobacteraceae bacterium]|jgi:PAS domain S-box-containing protein|nr:MHYT domain-containing protein [Bryobacteraceae bacterium]